MAATFKPNQIIYTGAGTNFQQVTDMGDGTKLVRHWYNCLPEPLTRPALIPSKRPRPFSDEAIKQRFAKIG